ncbi:ribosome silencing factor [Weissella diestrammenae]|uniref:Ribosomal silencing factor RsfS n=1 Tax=Weissella diestrammenae TaxID=1162633 RepID=A0A7G9T691_9LACO|nr:ribosome silencing factor [Weissella diestrammenae]MCM0583338.1 ribosome silencing factor [Weissella diestrammenae]QNN75616.1 ribosome silencing factor [Weissella diestrammenae]
MTIKNMLEVAVKAADAKRAEDIVAIDIHEVSLVADAFLILDAPTNRQVLAIVDEIEDQMAKSGWQLINHEGRHEGDWVLMNFGDLIVHVFKKDVRSFYGLEKLWLAQGQEINLDDWLIEETY